MSPKVRGPLPLSGGVHRASHHALEEWEVPLLPALQSARSVSLLFLFISSLLYQSLSDQSLGFGAERAVTMPQDRIG